jgi:pimeloyl-ACP methyl ester carboxylesterase
MARYGLKPFDQLAVAAPSDLQASQYPDVILIHGLDDPGKVWMNLAPALTREGFSVWIMTYPNDQPVSESAYFFLDQIKLQNLSGKKAISIVAHSMGGLVTREMLTNPDISYSQKSADDELPQVRYFIMVGTPNHGSEYARFHIFGEFRDQFVALLNGNYHWLQGIVDGAGEAGIDLIPDSIFLSDLNSRRHPANVKMMSIAGMMSPVQKKEFQVFIQNLGDELQGNARDTVKKMEDILISASEKIGDGLVSVDSARLPDIPFRIVPGTHLSIIRNILADSERIAPSIPIIIDQLKQ